MKFVVIGGAGFIGSHLVDKLDKFGKVIIVDDLSTGCVENVPNHIVQKNDVSYLNQKTYEILLDADYVFYLAAKARVQPSIENPLPYHRVNVNGLLNVLEALRNNKNLIKFVYSSSSSVYGEQVQFPVNEIAQKNPSSPYALQKLIGEQYIRLYADLYDVPAVSLRYFNVFGNRMPQEGAYMLLIGKWINLIKQKKPIEINGDGNQQRDFTFVGDVVRANMMAANSEACAGVAFGDAFNIGGGNPLSVNQVADIFEKVTKCDRIYKPPVIEPYKTHADISLAKETFGWEPETRLEDWLPIYLEREL